MINLGLRAIIQRVTTRPASWLICLGVIFSPYFIVCVLKQASSDMYFNGMYAEAKYYSGISLKIAEVIYPTDSDYYIELYKANIKINYDFPHYGTEVDADELLRNIVRFSKLNEDSLPFSVIFDIYVYGARIMNGNYSGRGGDLANYALKEASRLSYQNDLYIAKANEEVAFSDLVGFYASISPKTKKSVELNDFVFSEVEAQHNQAQAVICKKDLAACKFNRIRWFAGTCIRASYLAGDSSKKIPCGINRDLVDQVDSLCQGLGDDECAVVRNDLAPYYYAISFWGK